MLENIVDIITNWWPNFLEGIGVTLALALTGTIIGLFFGLGLALLRTINIADEKNQVIKVFKMIGFYFSKTYVTIFRGTPMMVQAMVIFYGIEGFLIDFDKTTNTNFTSIWGKHLIIAGIIVVSLNTTAYLAEVFRGGIQALDKGQMEAARSLGFNQFQTFVHVILPQALKNTMPSVGNEFIVNIKDTSVLSCIGIMDLFAYSEASAGMHIFESMIIAASIYLVLTYTTSKILMFIEKKWDMPVKEITSCN